MALANLSLFLPPLSGPPQVRTCHHIPPHPITSRHIPSPREAMRPVPAAVPWRPPSCVPRIHLGLACGQCTCRIALIGKAMQMQVPGAFAPHALCFFARTRACVRARVRKRERERERERERDNGHWQLGNGRQVLQTVVSLSHNSVLGRQSQGPAPIWAVRECLRPLVRLTVNCDNRCLLLRPRKARGLLLRAFSLDVYVARSVCMSCVLRQLCVCVCIYLSVPSHAGSL
jgi:hypothetical protein